MKALPYVYKLVHKETGEFYIGFRCANKVPANEDLGIKYFTSSKLVKKTFENFECFVLGEFEDKDAAYTFEQNLIKECFSNPLILNKHWQDTKTYSMLGFKRPDLGKLNSEIKRKPKEYRNYDCAQCATPLSKLEFIHHKPKEHYYCNAKCRNEFNRGPSKKGIKLPHLWGRAAWNKGLTNPTAAENARRGAEKQRELVTGRKRHYISETEWTWKCQDKDGWYIRQNGEQVPVL